MTNNRAKQINTSDIAFMEAALEEAQTALSEDEIPIGAVLVKDNIIQVSDHNRTKQLNNPLAHAEKLVIDSIVASGIKYLNEYTLYVTLEPCHMCSGMIIWSRIGRLVFAASDPKAGCVGSIYNILSECSFNHHPKIEKGILADAASDLLISFFRNKRMR